MRKRIPSDIKWLLNERAALAGDIVRLETLMAEVLAELTTARQAVTDLDIAIRITDERLRADAAGIVKRFNVAYGSRGALGGAIIDTFKSPPDGISTRGIGDGVATRFGLVFRTTQEKTRFIEHSIKKAVYRLVLDGRLEKIRPVEGSGRSVLYRWVEQQETFSDLLVSAESTCKA